MRAYYSTCFDLSYSHKPKLRQHTHSPFSNLPSTILSFHLPFTRKRRYRWSKYDDPVPGWILPSPWAQPVRVCIYVCSVLCTITLLTNEYHALTHSTQPSHPTIHPTTGRIRQPRPPDTRCGPQAIRLAEGDIHVHRSWV